jgi:hypothetical protein
VIDVPTMQERPYTAIMPTASEGTPDRNADLYAAALRELEEYKRTRAVNDGQQDQLYLAVKALGAADESPADIARRLEIKYTTVQYMLNTDLDSRRARREAKRSREL